MTQAWKTAFKHNIPFFIATLATFGYVFILEMSIQKATGGVFMYPLDDPFIHMQVAKNLAFQQTWGIFPGEFASASSSLLYTVLLAFIFKIFSVHVIIPFLVNCVAAAFLLYALHRWLTRQELSMKWRTLIMLAIVFFTPLPVLVISGMEHTLQCLFCFLFITAFADWMAMLEVAENRKLRLPIQLFLYAFLVIAVRYEGIFLVAIACCIMLFKRNIINAFKLGAVALLPVFIFGFISLSLGSYFLPNSVLVKSASAPFSPGALVEMVSNILTFKLTVVDPRNTLKGSVPPGISLLATQRLLIALPVIYFLFIKYFKEKKSYIYIFIILLLCTILHLSFAATGWFYRYEAYLIFCSLSFLLVIIAKYGHQFLSPKSGLSILLTAILVFALGFPFMLRSMAAYTKAKQACYNIYEQQYQMASFISEHYNGTPIAANDIGAISFYSESPIIDLWGLGSIEIARSKKERKWTPEFLATLVTEKKVQVAVVYDEWFDPKLLKNWTKVGTWEIFNNVICGGEVVSFYAIKPDEAAALRKKLMLFQQKLPGDIKVVYSE